MCFLAYVSTSLTTQAIKRDIKYFVMMMMMIEALSYDTSHRKRQMLKYKSMNMENK